jgi:fibro-slime domain-containing protein
MQQVNLNRVGNVYSFNSGGFFPIDGQGWVAQGEELSYQYDGGSTPHNYGFTTEVRYWFQFLGGETLTFQGDDDLHVFVNGQLALPIGSKHNATERTVVLNANGTATCADCTTTSRPITMTVGNVYEIAIFHAERQSAASNFNLSLTGFVGSKSTCGPVCGDGTQTFDEDCDNGDDNDDLAYGGCTTTCTRGPSCGDGILQAANEECDDGTNLTPYSSGSAGCAPGCKLGAYCGDAQVDSLFGEQCDDGVNAGGYNGCTSQCLLGPRCGDGELLKGTEQCDDGNLVTGDGCSSVCELEAPK